VTPAQLAISVEDAQGMPCPGHPLQVVMDEVTLWRGETTDTVTRATVVGQRRTGSRSVVATLSPRTSLCPRPWITAEPRAASGAGQPLRIRDVRGIPCRVAFDVSDGGGHVVFSGESDADGRATLPGAMPPDRHRFVVTGGQAAREMRWVADASVEAIAPVLTAAAQLHWRLPTPIEIRLTVVKRAAARVELRIVVVGMEQAVWQQRIEITATQGTLTWPQGSDRIVIELPMQAATAAPGLDVVARDPKTGVSVWLHVP